MTDTIDFAPHLIRRRMETCKHPSYVVSMTAARVTCGACEAPLDPWWVLRRFTSMCEEITEGLAAGRAEVARLKAEIEAMRK